MEHQMRSDDEFRAWAQQNRALLVRTATLLTAGDAHTAEDVVQTAMTKMYLAWPRLRGVQNRTAYARRVLVNAFTDEMRSTRRQREDLRSQLPDRVVADSAPDEDTRLLYEALADLPERMRVTVVLRYFHDLSVTDTARALDKLHARLGPLLADDQEPESRTTPVPTVIRTAVPARSLS
jgi:RNA polymerase sigma factor (sigma-70 family)